MKSVKKMVAYVSEEIYNSIYVIHSIIEMLVKKVEPTRTEQQVPKMALFCFEVVFRCKVNKKKRIELYVKKT